MQKNHYTNEKLLRFFDFTFFLLTYALLMNLFSVNECKNIQATQYAPNFTSIAGQNSIYPNTLKLNKGSYTCSSPQLKSHQVFMVRQCSNNIVEFYYKDNRTFFTHYEQFMHERLLNMKFQMIKNSKDMFLISTETFFKIYKVKNSTNLTLKA